MHRGYIKLYRRLLESGEWTKEKFTRGQAWVDLVGLANHKPGWIRARGVRVEIGRGQVGWSEVALAKRWKWSRNKIRNWLKELQEIEHQIEQQKNNVCSLITIINYDLYQGEGTAESTTEGQQKVQQKDSKRYTNKNDKNEKNTSKVQMPEWLNSELWVEFLEHRKKLRKPMTDFAQGLMFKKLIWAKDKGYNPEFLLKDAMVKGYQDIYVPKEN